MNFYTYSMPGTNVDALRTQEAFQTYVDCGFTVFHLTGKNAFCLNGEEPWETSNAKKCFDFAQKLGIKRIILRDHRLIDIIQDQALIGDGCLFATEAELDAYVRRCMKDYAYEKGFYGLGLRDEPTYRHITAYGEVYRAIKRVAKEFGYENLYVQVNLNPMIGPASHTWCADVTEIDEKTAYEGYLDSFFKATNADRISVDNYPFKPSYTGGRFLPGYYVCFQILQRKCQQYGAELSFVLQTFEAIHKTKPEATAGWRRVSSVNEMYLQMNSALGFGVRDISFYTYETPKETAESAMYRSDQGSSLVTDKGYPTRIYDFTKRVIAHAKGVESELCCRKWQGAKISVSESLASVKDTYLKSEGRVLNNELLPPSVDFENDHSFALLRECTFDRDVLLTTEFKGETQQAYMYMVCNVVDTTCKLDLAPMKISLHFEGCDKAKIYKYSEWKEVSLKDGEYETQLALGEAVFIIPQQK